MIDFLQAIFAEVFEKGADPNIGNSCKLTPLLAVTGHVTPMAPDKVQDVTQKTLDVLQMLVQYGASIHLADHGGLTPLQEHIEHSYAFPSVITYFVQEGAKPPLKQPLSLKVQQAIKAGIIMKEVKKYLPKQSVMDVVHDYISHQSA